MTANMYINKFNYAQIIIARQMSQINDMGQKILNYENDILKMAIDYRIMKDASLFKDSHIYQLESELHSFSNRLKRLNKNHPAKILFSKDVIQTLEEIRNKVHLQFAKRGQTVIANVLEERKREKMVQTEYQGIKNILEIHYSKTGELYAIKDTDKAIQAEPSRKDKQTSMPEKEGVDAQMITVITGDQLKNTNDELMNLMKDFIILENNF